MRLFSAVYVWKADPLPDDVGTAEADDGKKEDEWDGVLHSASEVSGALLPWELFIRVSFAGSDHTI